MKSPFLAYLRAFQRPYTYDFRKNTYLWLGLFWGLLIPCFVYALDVSLLGSKGPTGLLQAFRENPSHAILFLHPVVLGVLFGAAGTTRQELVVENLRLLETLEQLAMTDSLTGLYNRRFLQEAFKTLRESARRTGSGLFVVLIDLDGFKAVNDRQGHVKGDQVLCDVASALRSSLRQSDILGRHGGDEFILTGPGDRAAAEVLVARASQAVRDKTRLIFSFGIGCWPGDGSEFDGLIEVADRSLGTSKKKSQDSRTLPRVPSAQAEP